MLFDVCCMLNSKVWPNMQGSNGDTDEQLLQKQLEWLSNIYNRFQPILLKCLPSICLDELHNGYINIVQYANRYFNCVEIDPLDMWSTIKKIPVDKDYLTNPALPTNSVFVHYVRALTMENKNITEIKGGLI